MYLQLLRLFIVCLFFIETVKTSDDYKHSIEDNKNLYDRYIEIREKLFYLCAVDQQCSKKFFIQEKLNADLFEYFFDQFIIENDMKLYLIANFKNNSSIVEEMTLRMMRNVDFCHINEVVDSDGNCICKNGKICQELEPSRFNTDQQTFNFLFILIIIMIIYFSNAQMNRIKNLTSYSV